MRLFKWVLEPAAVTLALCAWALIPELLWRQDYNFFASLAFLLLPLGFFEIACFYKKLQVRG
jgi:hypothetical protein